MDTTPRAVPSRVDERRSSGSILVAVNGRSSGWQALDWAAAECAARRCPLRIVHVVSPAPAFDALVAIPPAWATPAPEIASRDGTRILDEAAGRAHRIAPGATVTTHLEFGNPAAAIRDAGSGDSLTVIGRGRARRLGARSATWRIARRALGPVAIVELDDQPRGGPSAGRVVLGITGAADPAPAVAHAFHAASQRGVGLTVVHACAGRSDPPSGRRRAADLHRVAGVEDVVRVFEAVHPRVDVRRRWANGSAGAALVAESSAAALLVIGTGAERDLRRLLLGSVARTATRRLHSPIAIIRAS